MKTYLSDADFTLYNGDACGVLAELPDESVHMCVTSPPFFGLRDYGTGTWEGGEPIDCSACMGEGSVEGMTCCVCGGSAKEECDHMPPPSSRGDYPDSDRKQQTNAGSFGYRGFGLECPKCGARRIDRQIGLEQTPEEWVASLVAVFEEVRRVLRKDGTLWVECGDSYATNRNDSAWPEQANGREAQRGKVQPAGTKMKDLIGQPFLLAFALREAGWYWRNVCIWHKPNPMPESVRDRFTVSHSYVLLFSKSPQYFFDAEAVREAPSLNSHPHHAKGQGRETPKGRIGHAGWDASANEMVSSRNARSVWTIATEPLPFEHYAAFPQALAERCIKAGTSERGCCQECGAPWVREVETKYVRSAGGTTGRKRDRSEPDGNQRGHIGKPTMDRLDTTIGWRPSCGCYPILKKHGKVAPPIHCTVLDPFLGSGTTALVARRLGRRCIGIELNEKYCQLAAERTKQLSLLAPEEVA